MPTPHSGWLLGALLLIGAGAAAQSPRAGGAGADATPPREVVAPAQDRLPELAAHSVWGSDPDTPRRAGAFPIGNGHVFTSTGRSRPEAGLHFEPLVGPWYGGADFGRLTLSLTATDGVAADSSSLSVRRVRGTAVVITERVVHAESGKPAHALRTVSWAPPGERSLRHLIEVADLDGAGLGASRLRIELHAAASIGCKHWGDSILATTTDGDWLTVDCSAARASRAPGGEHALEVLLAVPRGGRFQTVLEQRFGTAETTPGDAQLAFEPALENLRTTLRTARRDAENETRFTTGNRPLNDLLADAPAVLRTLRCARSGVCVPMLGRRIASVRDNSGALLLMLRYGMHREARQLLDYWSDAALATGRLAASWPLGLSAPPPTDPPTNPWQQITPPTADLAGRLVLQHFWYWRATRDADFVAAKWPLIEVCLKRAQRGEDGRVPFGGDEPWLAGGLAGEPDSGDARNESSFASELMFVMAVLATGDMLDGLEKARSSQRDRSEPRRTSAGQRYTARGFELMADLERRYWLTEQGRFAASLPAEGDAATTSPVANDALLPLWVGWTFPTGEKSRDNLRSSLAELWRKGARIGTTPTVGAATGDLQALLLTALSERDGAARMAVFDSILDLASTAGEWPAAFGADGQPLGNPAVGADFLEPGVLGRNVDALLFAITGIRYAAVPGWDDDDIRLELRTPPNTEWFTARGSRKDGRVLDLFLNRVTGPLNEAERAANAEKAAEHRRDPDTDHERQRFVIDLIEGAPPNGYYNVSINAEGTTFVRFLAPEIREGKNLRRIEEAEFANPDTLRFLPTDSPDASKREEADKAPR